jgi:mono/diheme cytochrome c family protein
VIRRTIWLLAVLTAGLLIGAIALRGRGFSARRSPLAIEARLARSSWRFLVPSTIRSAVNPTPATREVLQDAREHWADHCAPCHGNDGSGETTVGRHVYPPVPDMRTARSQDLTDGELFYAIEQGIPWTAMPAWSTGTPEGEQASWSLVRFIRHLPSLSADELRDMERFNAKSPADLERERDIDEFLNGPAKKTGGREGGAR